MEELMNRLNQEVEKGINEVVETGIQPDNIEKLYKLVDIHKDIANEEYWKEDKMKYGTYGRNSYGAGNYDRGSYNNYGAGNYGGNYGRGGRYSGNYGRQGVDAKYRGEEIMDEMYQAYQDYSEGKENYGADTETMESFKYMVKSFKDYYKHLKQNASSQEEMQILEQAINEMASM